MIIGFTGPEKINGDQERRAEHLVRSVLGTNAKDVSAVVSGGAEGVDTVAAQAVHMLKMTGALPDLRLILVVPNGLRWNRSLAVLADEIIRVDGGFMARNDRLVELSDRVVGIPKTAASSLRSGTWSTIRRAAKADKLHQVLPLDGSTWIA